MAGNPYISPVTSEMHIGKVIALLFAFAMIQTAGLAQIGKGHKYFEMKNYPAAIEAYETYIGKKKSPDPEAIINLAESYRQSNNFAKSEYWYRKTVHLLAHDSIHKVHYGQVLKNNGKYEEAATWFKLYLYSHPNDQKVKQLLASCDSNQVKRADKNRYEVNPLGGGFHNESFSPVPYRKGFVNARWEEDEFAGKGEPSSRLNLVYTPINSKGEHLEPFILRGFLHTSDYIGSATFSPDGEQMFFTLSTQAQGKLLRKGEGIGQTVIYVADLKDNTWTNMRPLFEEDGGYSFGHPSLSTDGKTMYMVSNRPGGYGGFDIYYSMKKDSSWTFPSNMGHLINSDGDELFPAMARNKGKDILYFSSDGRIGLGGLDIYYAEIVNKKALRPNHFSSPINSSRDDFGLMISKDGSKGYLSSNRNSDEGLDEILAFSITEVTDQEVEEEIEAYKDSLKKQKGGLFNRIFKGKKKEDKKEEKIITFENNKKAAELLASKLSDRYPGKKFNNFLYVDVKSQTMFYVEDERLKDSYQISTSKYGLGQREGSEKTPEGLHTIHNKIGGEVPHGGIIKYRAYTGRVAQIVCDPVSVGTDDCTTRIMWLRGAEYGFNRGGVFDSHARNIYIHGTPEEGLLGVPSSHGCIRMSNGDVIDLFNRVKEGTAVAIMPN